jgi:hypothetical protein
LTRCQVELLLTLAICLRALRVATMTQSNLTLHDASPPVAFRPTGEPVLTNAARPSSRSAVILLILMTVLALPYLWSSAFSGFSWFDDEGTLLVSIRFHRRASDVR